MRPLPSFLSLALLVIGLALPGARAEFVLFKNIWGDVIVSTDTTVPGKEITPPNPDQPVYYKGISLGRKLGSVPMVGDREPDVKQLNQFVADILAKQGYLAAQPGGPEPTLFLVIQWGYLEPGSDNLLWFLGYNPKHDIAAATMITEPGPEVLLQSFRSTAVGTILQDAQGPIYGIIVTAFDFKTARTTSPVAYWQTRIGLPAGGKSMAGALPAMVAAAGPAIGRPADRPVLLDTDNARKGSVTFGELKFHDSVRETPRGQETETTK
jgi:hypothetical protein